MELLFILFIGFVFRILFLLSETSDEYSHIWLIKRRKRFGNLWQGNVEDSVVKGYRGYPILPHYIVSLFPEKYWLVTGKLLNIAYDLIAIIIVYYLSTFLFTNVWQLSLDGMITAPVAVTMLYATSPILHPVTARLKAIGGRTLGNVFCLGYMVLLGYAFLTDRHLIYLICIPFGWAIMLSSQFGMQYIIFSSFLLSIFYLNPLPIILICLTVLSGILMPKLGLRKVLQRKIDHYIWYIKNYTKGTTASNRNKIKDIMLLPLYLIKKQEYFIKLCFTKITPIITAYSIPSLVLLTFWIVMSPKSISLFVADDVTLFLSFLSISTIFLFIITSLKYFLFLGQAERYFEYSAGFIYVLFIYYISKVGISSRVLYWLLFFQMTIILGNFLYSQRHALRERLTFSEKNKFRALIDYLENLGGLKLLSIPTKWNFKIATYLDNTDALFYYDNISNPKKIDGIKYMQEDHILLHYVKPDMQYFANKYGINTVVVQKKELKNAENLGINYEFKDCKKLFENDEYLVYKIVEK